MLPKVVDVKVAAGYRLKVSFSDGSGGMHDFSTMVGEGGSAIEPLREDDYFGRVFLDMGALTWPNGFDIAPEWLQREMLAAGELEPRVAVE